MHNCNFYYLYLLLFRPIKKDVCDRCCSFANAKLNVSNPPTTEQEKAQTFHLFEGDIMKNRMMVAEEACKNETKREKMRRLKKEKAQKSAQANSCENAPSAPTTSCVNTKETNKKSKPKKIQRETTRKPM